MKGRGVGAQGIQTSRREGGLKLVCVALEGLDALWSDCQQLLLFGLLPPCGGEASRNLPMCVPTLFGGWDPHLVWTAGGGEGFLIF